MSQPISLSDSELTAVMDAATPLQPRDRDRFLKGVAHAIAELPERGPGSVYRAIASVWRQHFDAPDLRASEPRSNIFNENRGCPN
jgi:hypothetical protein